MQFCRGIQFTSCGRVIRAKIVGLIIILNGAEIYDLSIFKFLPKSLSNTQQAYVPCIERAYGMTLKMYVLK